MMLKARANKTMQNFGVKLSGLKQVELDNKSMPDGEKCKCIFDTFCMSLFVNDGQAGRQVG
jgi:hypothetical protein